MELQLGSDAVRDACLVCATSMTVLANSEDRRFGAFGRSERHPKLNGPAVTRFSREWLLLGGGKV